MHADELDFQLPPELIAQEPAERREASRLLHYRRADRSIEHRQFTDLPGLLRPGDLLVFNDARVLPARFVLRRATGGRVEGLFVSQPAPGRWRALLKGLDERLPTGLHFERAPEIRVDVVARIGAGEHELAVYCDEAPGSILARVGRMPMPPYIHRGKSTDDRDEMDRERYQTVFARAPGAVAAPTAALHFSQPLLEALDAAGVERTFVTLDVGLGTFKPITADDLDRHAMHCERYAVTPAAAADLNRARADNNRRIIAVGTTSARVLESQPPAAPFAATSAETSIFIRPGYAWKHTDALITNFHLPRSTLIALVAALVGLDEQRRIYRAAIEQRYRFFSYGDAMLIE